MTILHGSIFLLERDDVDFHIPNLGLIGVVECSEEEVQFLIKKMINNEKDAFQ